MPVLPPTFRPAHLPTREQQRRAFDARRRYDQPWRALYKTREWAAARLAQLAQHPLCERCLARGELVPATVVNHRKRHRGDWTLFFDPANHESACKACHDGEIKREEIEIDAEGTRTDRG